MKRLDADDRIIHSIYGPGTVIRPKIAKYLGVVGYWVRFDSGKTFCVSGNYCTRIESENQS